MSREKKGVVRPETSSGDAASSVRQRSEMDPPESLAEPAEDKRTRSEALKSFGHALASHPMFYLVLFLLVLALLVVTGFYPYSVSPARQAIASPELSSALSTRREQMSALVADLDTWCIEAVRRAVESALKKAKLKATVDASRNGEIVLGCDQPLPSEELTKILGDLGMPWQSAKEGRVITVPGINARRIVINALPSGGSGAACGAGGRSCGGGDAIPAPPAAETEPGAALAEEIRREAASVGRRFRSAILALDLLPGAVRAFDVSASWLITLECKCTFVGSPLSAAGPDLDNLILEPQGPSDPKVESLPEAIDSATDSVQGQKVSVQVMTRRIVPTRLVLGCAALLGCGIALLALYRGARGRASLHRANGLEWLNTRPDPENKQSSENKLRGQALEARRASEVFLVRSWIMLISGIMMAFVGLAVFFVSVPTATVEPARRLGPTYDPDYLMSFRKPQSEESAQALDKAYTEALIKRISGELKPPQDTRIQPPILEYVRPALMLLFIEALAWFLLRQYRVSMSEYKAMHRLYMRRLNVLASHSLITGETPSRSQQALAVALLKEELDARLEQGQTTTELKEQEQFYKDGDSNFTLEFLRLATDTVRGVVPPSDKPPGAPA